MSTRPAFNRHDFLTPSERLDPARLPPLDLSAHPDYQPIHQRLAQGKPDQVVQAFVLAMRQKESWLLEKAFAARCGSPDPVPQHDAAEVRTSLAEDYIAFQIAPGRHAAEERIRELESEAHRRAEQLLPSSRLR